jgi:hypothetical protein
MFVDERKEIEIQVAEGANLDRNLGMELNFIRVRTEFSIACMEI